MLRQESSGKLVEYLEMPSDNSVTVAELMDTVRHFEKTKSQQQQKQPEGSECAIQVLYEGPPKCQCCKNWVEEYPSDLRQQLEDQAEIKQKAFVKRMRKNHDDTTSNGKPLVLDSIVVQSSSLKKTLSEVFDGYKGITPSLQKVVFKAPFHPFYHRWGLFTEIVERQKRDDPEAAAYSVLLYDELQKELGDMMAEIHDHIDHGVITYRLLWALFEPGALIVARKDGHERFYIVESHGYNDKDGIFVIGANHVDWDGQRFGYTKEGIIISQYAGTTPITSLPGYPANLHPAQDEARAKAINRGQKFRDLSGFQYKAYSGLVWYHYGTREMQCNIDGRIIVDAAAYFHANAAQRRPITALDADSIAPQIDVVEEEKHFYDGAILRPPQAPPQRRGREMLRRGRVENGDTTSLSEKLDPKPEASNLTDEQLLLCSTRLRGYSLTLKRWVLFDLDNITDISWNDGAFNKLMLPDGYQNLILSFIEAQSDKDFAFDDIIQGKGMGIIMLLVGQPGTGKTLTAEAVADKVRKPLYMLSAGELGQDADSVETRLREVLELTEKWDAVLLFDECDVFLQERSVDNMAHNEIVAVFLRLLEYYRGIMLMTTNRANTIDRAFQSRIHLTLHYPELDAGAKEHIWRHFTAQVEQDNTLTDEIYGRLAKLPMNGRQIKNTVKISALLAHKEKAKFGIQHVRTVLRATREADGEGI